MAPLNESEQKPRVRALLRGRRGSKALCHLLQNSSTKSNKWLIQNWSLEPRFDHLTKIVSDLDYCQPTSAGPQINKVVIWVAVKYKQTKKSNKVSSWNWAVSSHSAVEDAPAAWPKRRKLAFLNARSTGPRSRQWPPWVTHRQRPRFLERSALHWTKMTIE